MRTTGAKPEFKHRRPTSAPTGEENTSPDMPEAAELPPSPGEQRVPETLSPDLGDASPSSPPPPDPAPEPGPAPALLVELEQLKEKLRQKDKHLDSLREQRNELHRQLRETHSEQQKRLLEQLRGEKEAGEARLKALEAELTQQRQPVEKLQAKIEALLQQLVAKERELSKGGRHSEEVAQAQEATKRALTQVRDLEVALKQAEEHANKLRLELVSQKKLVETLQAEKAKAPLVTEAAPSSAAGMSAGGLTPERADTFYKEAVTPLTVLVASADLLALDQRLDPALRETAAEMKAQSQALMQLIKNYTHPPDSKSD